jgi:hypothetical protein
MINLFSDQEVENAVFLATFTREGLTYTADVHEIHMGGWVLFECFLFPHHTVIYFSLDEDTNELEWIDMDGEDDPEHVTVLLSTLQERIRRKTA